MVSGEVELWRHDDRGEATEKVEGLHDELGTTIGVGFAQLEAHSPLRRQGEPLLTERGAIAVAQKPLQIGSRMRVYRNGGVERKAKLKRGQRFGSRDARRLQFSVECYLSQRGSTARAPSRYHACRA